MINEGALRQFLVMAFEHLKDLNQALTDTNEEHSMLLEALRNLKDKRIDDAVKQARESRRNLAAAFEETPHGEVSSAGEYDQIIQRLLDGEVC